LTNDKDRKTEVREAVSRYSRQELIANARAIFRHAPEVVAGALHENNAQELTLAEVKQAIKDFLERKAI